MNIQPKGKEKQQVSTRVHRQIRKSVEFTANRFECSKSWVIAVALADFFGIEIPRYNSSKGRVVQFNPRRAMRKDKANGRKIVRSA